MLLNKVTLAPVPTFSKLTVVKSLEQGVFDGVFGSRETHRLAHSPTDDRPSHSRPGARAGSHRGKDRDNNNNEEFDIAQSHNHAPENYDNKEFEDMFLPAEENIEEYNYTAIVKIQSQVRRKLAVKKTSTKVLERKNKDLENHAAIKIQSHIRKKLGLKSVSNQEMNRGSDKSGSTAPSFSTQKIEDYATDVSSRTTNIAQQDKLPVSSKVTASNLTLTNHRPRSVYMCDTNLILKLCRRL